MDTKVPVYAIVLALNAKPFDADTFWFHFERACTGTTKNLVSTPHVIIQLAQSAMSAGQLRGHLDGCPRDGIRDAHILRLHADRYLPSGHAAAGWLTRHVGDIPSAWADAGPGGSGSTDRG